MNAAMKPVRILGDISIWTLHLVANSCYCASVDSWVLEIIVTLLKGRR